MKINSLRSCGRVAHGNKGMATVVFIALLAIMMTLILVESSSLIRLHRELKLLEQQQMKRLAGLPKTPAGAILKETK